jgi:hypothetical protein
VSRSAAPQPKTLNLNTYKIHALGNYVSTIREFGTTDSYSTEMVCDPWGNQTGSDNALEVNILSFMLIIYIRVIIRQAKEDNGEYTWSFPPSHKD